MLSIVITFDNSEIDLVQGVINVEGVMGLNSSSMSQFAKDTFY
jgi:hypothetical protein